MQAKLILAGIILGIIGLCGWYYKWSQAEIKVLNGNITKLEQGIELQKAAVKALQENNKQAAETLGQIDRDFKEARKENSVLRKKLARHDLGYLAANKPGLITKIVNKGTKDANRCLEIMSGSPLTEAEKAATKKSQANTSCPKLANPNYKARK